MRHIDITVFIFSNKSKELSVIRPYTLIICIAVLLRKLVIDAFLCITASTVALIKAFSYRLTMLFKFDNFIYFMPVKQFHL